MTNADKQACKDSASGYRDGVAYALKNLNLPNVVMYLDGSTEQPQVRGTATNVTTFANFEPGLEPGRHTVVVAATEGRQAGATAWVFTVRKPVGTPGSTGG